MANIVRYHPLIPADLREAIDWYEERSSDAAARFRQRVNETFFEIECDSLLFAFVFGDLEVRFANIKKFPYLVLFRCIGEVIHLYGVFHSASDPAKWRKRILS